MSSSAMASSTRSAEGEAVGLRRNFSGSLRTGSTAPANSTLTRKLKKVLDVPMDDNMRASLAAISDVYALSNDDTQTHQEVTERRNLRSALESRTLALHATFLQEFQKVAEQFDRVAADVDTLSTSCNSMSTALKTTRANSITMTDQLAVLQNELDEAKAKEDQVKSFLARFHLTAEEKAVLHRDVSPQFFSVLDKVKDIHSHCVELLNAQHQQAGVEVMEMTHIQQTQGYEKLNRWVHHQTQTIMTHDVPDIPTLYVRAMHSLKDRSALWCSCMRDIAQIRRTTLVRKLFTILTRGEDEAQPSGGAENLQSIASVLAWVHQSVAEEADLLDNFFSNEKALSDSTSLRSSVGNVGEKIFEVSRADLLDTVFEGLVRHLRLRIERALEATPIANEETSLVFFFKLESILQFYCAMVTPLLGKSAALSQLLGDLKLATLKSFFDVLKKVSDHIIGSTCQPGPDLAPPPLMYESLAKLRLMMDTLADSLTPPEERESEFGAVISGIIEPLLKVLERVESLDSSSKCTLTVNCLYLIVTTFAEQPFTRTKALLVKERLDNEVQLLVSLQADALLRRSGLNDVHAKILSHRETAPEHRQPLSSYSVTSVDSIQESVQTFYKFMYTLGSVTFPLSQRIQAAPLKAQVNQDTIKAICDAYDLVCN